MNKANQILSDEELMELVSTNQTDRLAILFDRYHLLLFNFYKKMTGNAALSEDLTQNVFERILKHRQTYKRSYPFKGWIFRIARNLLADHYRKKNISIDYNRTVENIDIADDDSTENEEIKMIQQALQLLKYEFREVLILTRYQQMKYQEVAQLLGLTENGVKARVHRALKELKIYFNQLSLYEKS